MWTRRIQRESAMQPRTGAPYRWAEVRAHQHKPATDLACAPDACCASVEVFCGQIRRSLGKEAWNEACDAYFYSSGGIAPNGESHRVGPNFAAAWPNVSNVGIPISGMDLADPMKFVFDSRCSSGQREGPVWPLLL